MAKAILKAIRPQYTPIKLEFECSAQNGKCVWRNDVCIEMNNDEEAYVCPYLKAVRKEAKL